jgi:membrane-associated phospholipid phosphatase
VTAALRVVFGSRRLLALLLLGVFVVNFVETQLEARFKSPGAYALGYRVNQAFHEIEGGIDFTLPANMDRIAVAGYSFAYFFLLPAMLVWAAVSFWRRQDVREFRIFSVAIAINYLLALPFFLLLPVPERWAFPGAKATLLSDLLSSRLIEVIRPISGIDNCFPSAHVALTVLIVLQAYWCRAWWRHTATCLGAAVILSTFFLGIHWIPDMIMGAASAALSFALAVALDRKMCPPIAGTTGTRNHFRPTGSRPAWRTRPPIGGTRQPMKKQVFISYRREGGSRLARVVQIELEGRGWPCFLDVDDLGAEHFDDRLLREIENAPNTVLVLAPGSLERCRRQDDWLRREIEHALKYGRNVVPLLADGFQFPADEDLPEGLRNLGRLNGVTYSHEYFTAAFDKLEGFLKRK